MNRVFVAAVAVFLSLLVFHLPAQAQTGPPVNAYLREAVNLIPIPGVQGAVSDMFASLKPMPGGGYVARKTIASTPLQLYVYGDSDRQAIFLVVNAKVSMPAVFNSKAWRQFAGSSLIDPIFSLATIDFTLQTKDMPSDFQQTIANSYFNVDSLDFKSGFQVATKVSISGIMKTALEVGMGLPAQNWTMRAGVSLPTPTDRSGQAALATSILADLKNFNPKDLPEFYVELQPAPGTIINGPLGMNGLKLSDSTFFANNQGAIGYKGNFIIPSGKKFISFFETPIAPSGALDLLDFKFGLAAQSITLEEYVNLGLSMNSPKLPGGSFLKNIAQVRDKLALVTKPLSVFQLRNPMPVPEYTFGDKNKPFPPLSAFNILVLGPMATEDDDSCTKPADGVAQAILGSDCKVRGPLLKLVGNATVLGLEVGSMKVLMNENGLSSQASAGLMLKLGPLGKQGISMASKARVTKNVQSIEMKGNFLGRVLTASLDPNQLMVRSPATCLTPFAISMDAPIQANVNLAGLLDSLPGVNVDPTQITGCYGEDLKKALQWVSSTGQGLGGYTANAANAELKKIDDAAKAEYNRVKDVARDSAQKLTNDAAKAFADAGNWFKRIGKKKHKKGPDNKFAASVFDWDYYYDARPDVLKAGVDLATHWRNSGFNEGSPGSFEFSAAYYLGRYPDLMQYCKGGYACALDHWLFHGIDEGRQGSPGFNVMAYLNRYPDLQKAFGNRNYSDALNHWLTYGKDEGRVGSP